ncbi:hypothetical protein [Bosea vaviloviae]|uniref:Uncharacterized protein n=1 Tax=Bosea vaviloviae TaxID=1526658 RepID=A0A0N0MA71_9HYPH|nr:hypothetical protein [Bosea vaviloviae]KPH79304.1 hypothetical protein AE618_18525 [Bosea vaviloviae]
MTPTRQTIFVADNPDGRGNCQSAVLASLLDLPLDQVIDTAGDEVRKQGFWKAIGLWLADRGLKIVQAQPGDDRLKGAYSSGCGPSPRGDFWHAVVCKNGVMVFDPHPSDDGVRSIERHDLIVPMTEVEIRLHKSRCTADKEP